VVADRVLLVHEGRLIYDGTPDDLKENGSLEEPFYRLTDRGRAPSGGVEGDAAEPPRMEVKA
jgi:ABC-type multidrug transport system ATPase subunit